jgi:glycosyltransferase involved in cell wall biosynthesis
LTASEPNCTVARSIFFYTDSRELGGAENALLMLIEGLERDAWQPTLLLDADPGADPLAGLASGLGVTTVRIPPMPLGPGGARRVPRLAGRLRSKSPDLFHAHMSSPLSAKWGLAAAVLARLPTVATLQLIPDHRLDRSSRLQLRVLAAGVDRWIAVSRDIAAKLAGDLHWPQEKIAVIPNAVSVERFGSPPPAGLRSALTGGRDLPLVLTLARLTDQKGHDVLLRAAAEIEDAVFALAGDGPLRAELEAEAARLGIGDRVVFLGHRTDVPDLLAACDVFALPSLYEGTSLAVLEAMAAGRAVIGSSIGGTSELIEDGSSGLLVPPGDAAALAAGLRRLLADSALRDSLAAGARRRVESDFTRQAMTERVERVYGRLLGDGSPAER